MQPGSLTIPSGGLSAGSLGSIGNLGQPGSIGQAGAITKPGNITLASIPNQVDNNQSTINNALAQFNSQQGQISNLLQSIQAMERANAPGVAPSLNLNSINAQAQQAAGNSVNPLYTQYLNQYLQQEGANRQAAQAQNTLNIQGEQTSLGNTLAQNTLQEQAAARGNELQQGNINVQQQNYELTAGNAENQKLSAVQQGIGSGNLGASGIGQQQIYNAENASNAANAAQRGQFQYQRDTSNLSTQDTFAQLAQSSQYATTAEGQAETQTKFNLNDYLRQADYNDTQYRQQLEQARQEALFTTTQQQQAQLVQQRLSTLNPTGSKNYAAGEQAYANLLNPSYSNPSAPRQSDYLAQIGNNL